MKQKNRVLREWREEEEERKEEEKGEGGFEREKRELWGIGGNEIEWWIRSNGRVGKEGRKNHMKH